MPASNYQKFSGTIQPLPDHVLVCNMETGERTTKGGIIVLDDNGSAGGVRPRWCQVYKVGKNVTGLSEGEWVLIEHGQWTYGFDFFDTDLGERLYIQRINLKGAMVSSNIKPF